MKKFTEYLEEQNIVLFTWQEEACSAFLEIMMLHTEMMSGKTFAVDTLQKFTEAHGNDFEIETSRPHVLLEVD